METNSDLCGKQRKTRVARVARVAALSPKGSACHT